MSDEKARVMPPVPGEPPELRSPSVQRFQLANGLRVLVVEQPGLPIVDVQLVIRTGAVCDGEANAGHTSLAVDMLDEGTPGRSAIEVAESIEDLGASLSMAASWDDSALGLHVHTDQLEPALGLMADIVIRPTMPAADFERKKQQRLTAILQEKEEPRALASQAFNAVVFGGTHAYGSPLHGTRASIERMTRDDAVAYHHSFVRPGNSFLVVVGDISATALVPLLDRVFADWTDGASVAASVATPVAAPVAPPVAAPVAPPRGPWPPSASTFAGAGVSAGVHIVDRPGSAQSELRAGCIGVPRSSPDYFPIVVLNTLLGGSFTSRLNLNLRQDKGYTYGAGSSFVMRLDAGPFIVSTAVDTAVTDDAVRQILAEITRLREETVPADELLRAQSYIALGLPRSFETTADVASHVAELEVYGLGDDYFDSYVRRIRAVTAADVMRVAKQYLNPRHMNVVVAGDAAKIAEPMRALGIGTVYNKAIEE